MILLASHRPPAPRYFGLCNEILVVKNICKEIVTATSERRPHDVVTYFGGSFLAVGSEVHNVVVVVIF